MILKTIFKNFYKLGPKLAKNQKQTMYVLKISTLLMI